MHSRNPVLWQLGFIGVTRIFLRRVFFTVGSNICGFLFAPPDNEAL